MNLVFDRSVAKTLAPRHDFARIPNSQHVKASIVKLAITYFNETIGDTAQHGEKVDDDCESPLATVIKYGLPAIDSHADRVLVERQA